MEDIKRKVYLHLISQTDFLKVKDTLSDDQLRDFVKQAIDAVSEEQNLKITPEEFTAIAQQIVTAVVSLGPIRTLVEDPEISEIMVNGPYKVYIQKKGRIELTKVEFNDTVHLMHTIQKMLAASDASRRVDESSPYVDFSLRDGSRVNVILPPCSLAGPVITIRKFSTEINTLDDLIDRRMLNTPMAEFLIAAIKAKLNIVFCGATGAGKTTVLNVLSQHIPEEERIITIEDTPELRLKQEHTVSLQSKDANIEGKGAISIRQLFVNSLRMRPDRIIIGEVRGDEAFDMMQAITSGHTGSLAIVHADSPEDCFDRLITMLLMSGIQLSTQELKKQIANAVDLVVHSELFLDGRRRITHITDVIYDRDAQATLLKDIFRFEQEKTEDDGTVVGDWVLNNRKPSFFNKFHKRNIELPQGIFED